MVWYTSITVQTFWYFELTWKIFYFQHNIGSINCHNFRIPLCPSIPKIFLFFFSSNNFCITCFERYCIHRHKQGHGYWFSYSLQVIQLKKYTTKPIVLGLKQILIKISILLMVKKKMCMCNGYLTGIKSFWKIIVSNNREYCFDFPFAFDHISMRFIFEILCTVKYYGCGMLSTDDIK